MKQLLFIFFFFCSLSSFAADDNSLVSAFVVCPIDADGCSAKMTTTPTLGLDKDSPLLNSTFFEYIAQNERGSLKGDVNGDGVVNIDDVSSVISVICGGTVYKNASDVNGDGNVNIDDVSKVISIICGEK